MSTPRVSGSTDLTTAITQGINRQDGWEKAGSALGGRLSKAEAAFLQAVKSGDETQIQEKKMFLERLNRIMEAFQSVYDRMDERIRRSFQSLAK